MFSAESSSKPARFKSFWGKGETPPSRVEKPFAKPAFSNGLQVNTLTGPSSRQWKPLSVRIAFVSDIEPAAAERDSEPSMILSIGTDIVEVYRIRETIARTPRFAERVFTRREREYCESKGAASAQSYAGRFAAKEAFLKALKTGWRGKVKLTENHFIHDP